MNYVSVGPAWLLADAGADIWNSNFVAAAVGFVSALLVWGLTEWRQAKRQRQEDILKYLALVRAIRNELKFYGDKLVFLSKQLDDAQNAIQGRRIVLLPSYSLYPAFLERAKQELSGHFRNDALVRELGHCHFELCHIVERIGWLKSLPTEILVQNLTSVGGVKELVDSNIPVFQRIEALFAEEEDRERSRVKPETALSA